MASQDGRSYAAMSKEDLIFEQSMQHMMLASLEGAPGNVAAQKAEIDGRLRQINRALKTLDQTSQNHQTGVPHASASSSRTSSASRHVPHRPGSFGGAGVYRHDRGPAKRTFETNVGHRSPPRPNKLFRPSPSSPPTTFDSPRRDNRNSGRQGGNSSPPIIDLTDDPDVLSVQEAEVERFRKLKQQERDDAELARRLQYASSSSPTPGPSSRPDPQPADWPAGEQPLAPSQIMPGSFDDSIDSLFGDDLVGDSTTFSDVTPSAMLYSNAAQAQGDRSDSSYGMLPATERARQAALQRQEQQFRNSDMLLPESQFISSHQTQRPGSLTNGSANLLQFGSATSTPYTQSYSRGGLRDIINRTAGYDYTNAVDRLGNPLDQRIIDLIGNHESSPSQEEGIERLLANLNSEAEFKDEDGVADPEELAYPLYKHQRRALRWMRQSEEDDHKKGGILADEMGLGKTISTLALIVSRRAQPSEGDNSPQAKTTLVVAPLSVLHQWEDEITRKLRPQHRLNVTKYHGSKVSFDTLRDYDVVVTTYGMLTSEMGKLDEYLKEDGPKDNQTLSSLFPLLGPNSLWYRVILDEAHNIKNAKTKTAKAVHRLKAVHRWCLSGTPMMNNVAELSSLVTFLGIEPYCAADTFKGTFGCLGKPRAPGFRKNDSMRKLQVLLKAIMLRRKKDSKIDGQPIIQLPPKVVEEVHVVFDEDQAAYYRDLEKNSQVQFNKYLKQGAVGKKYAAVLTLLLRLRQACCHPHLHLTDLDFAGNSEVTEDIMVELAKHMNPTVIKRLQEKITNEEEKAFECPVCDDASFNFLFALPCGHHFCTECFAKIIDFDSRQGRSSNCSICRRPIEPQKTVTCDVFKRVHLPDLVKDEYETDTDYDSDLDEEGFKGDEVDSKGNLKGFVEPDSDDDSGDEMGDIEVDDDLKPEIRKRPSVKNEPDSDGESDEFDEVEKSVGRHKKLRGKGKGKAKATKSDNEKPKKLRRKGTKVAPAELHMLGQLRKEARKNKRAYKKYMQCLRSNWEPSAKVTKCEELIQDIQSTGEKTIVFSQWTLLLDLVEVRLKHGLQIKYRRYDGGMSHNMRVSAARDFADDPDVKVILVSLKAGNAGLNLNAASQVIIMDPHWNPSLELQAIDRAHRIGQQRPVKVHRILVKDTIEDRIMELQRNKREVVEGALDDSAQNNISSLGINDLRFLFGLGGRGDARG